MITLYYIYVCPFFLHFLNFVLLIIRCIKPYIVCVWVCVCVHVCLSLCYFVTCGALDNHHHNQDIELYPSAQDFFLSPFYSHTHLLPSILNPNSQQPIFYYLYYYSVSQMLNKWNHPACISLRLAFFIQHNVLEVPLRCCLYQ